jgi:hypothetical protein
MNNRDFYLDYVNNYLTVTAIAADHNVTEAEALARINQGRVEHELAVAGVRVSNTSGRAGYPSAVRVYLHNRLIAEVTLSCRNPLGYLRDRKRSKHVDSLRDQCLAGGLTEELFAHIVRK